MRVIYSHCDEIRCREEIEPKERTPDAEVLWQDTPKRLLKQAITCVKALQHQVFYNPHLKLSDEQKAIRDMSPAQGQELALRVVEKKSAGNPRSIKQLVSETAFDMAAARKRNIDIALAYQDKTQAQMES